MLSRRGLLLGAAAVAAPAIIRPGLLMPVKRILMPDDGVALQSIPHPHNNLVTHDLTEESLVKLMEHIWREAKRPLRLRPTQLVVDVA
jgi:hypothetical protein